eukprot:4582762-Prymnesium_polylepis.1
MIARGANPPTANMIGYRPECTAASKPLRAATTRMLPQGENAKSGRDERDPERSGDEGCCVANELGTTRQCLSMHPKVES